MQIRFLAPLLLATPALAQQIPDRATLDALLGADQKLTDFETYQINPGTQEDLGVPGLDSTTVANGQGPGLVTEGPSFDDLTGSALLWQGDGYAGIPTGTLGVQNEQLWISNFSTVHAVGFDVMSPDGQPFLGEVTFLTCSGGGGGTIPVQLSGGGNERVFVGWQSDKAICTIEVYATDAASGPLVIEDYGYGPLHVYTRYCWTNPNSTGLGASISATGSNSLADNDLTLIADSVPPNQFVVFAMGKVQDASLFGNGFRCLMPPVVMIPPPEKTTGTLQRKLDLVAFGIQPQTYYFQAWYRDKPGGGAEYNSTDGIAVTFVP